MRNIMLVLAIYGLCLFLTNGYAADNQVYLKGKIADDIESGWPSLSTDNKQIMLVGNSDILQEIYGLKGKEVLLKGKELPKQKVNDKEYSCLEVDEIEQLYGQDYLSPRKALKEFRGALEKRGLTDSAGQLKLKGQLKSIWYDKNENRIIDKDDKLFITATTAGKSSGQYLLYPAKVVSRRYKAAKSYYHTFILPDPSPQNFDPAILGKLMYDEKSKNYSLGVSKICAAGDENLRLPREKEKNINLGNKGILQPFVGKLILLSGNEYENLLWYGDTLKEINRIDGQYVIKIKGKISIFQDDSYKPWELSLVFLEDNQGQLYELRKTGYVSFWLPFINKEVTIGGILRPVSYYKVNKRYPVVEVVSIE